MIRAGILVTGTEVLTGAVSDRNGPWVSMRLQELGIDVAQICLVGDREADMQHALEGMRQQGVDILVTSGGLGPTADDRTVEEIARWLQLELVLDAALQRRIEEIVRALRNRNPAAQAAFDAGNRKQATVPMGSTILDPVGTAPGLVIAPPRAGYPTVVVLPGPPRELQEMWAAAIETDAFESLLAGIERGQVRTMRLFGVPESELAQGMREAIDAGVPLERLEVSTCQHRGELEITTRVPPRELTAYDSFAGFLGQRYGEQLFSTDGMSIDEIVASALRGQETIATAESCTGGMLAARLTDMPGASSYVLGGIIAYADEVKARNVGVEAELLERHGAVSEEVARALADGVRQALRAGIGVGVTGIAGPSGGSEEKPVGLVWLAVAGPGRSMLTRSVRLPGARAEIRERAVTVAMHLIRQAARSLAEV